MSATWATTNEHNLRNGETFTYFGGNPKGPWQRAGVDAIIRQSGRVRFEIVAADSGLRLESVALNTKFWATRNTVESVSA
jgi:hypothetical protein